jgi:Flp pilus assembly pilin Flp
MTEYLIDARFKNFRSRYGRSLAAQEKAMKWKLQWLREKLRQLKNNEIGQDLIEYGLLASLIAAACIASISPVATRIANMFSNISITVS